MAQFDVHPNPQPIQRQFVPYLVDVQSDLLDSLPTRLVIPLSRVGAKQKFLPTHLCPSVMVEGETLSLLSYSAAAVPARLLQKSVASLQSHALEITVALDAVVSGI